MGQFNFGQARLHLVKKFPEMSKKEFDAKFNIDNIVAAKLQVTLSDGSVIEIDADILELLWQHCGDE